MSKNFGLILVMMFISASCGRTQSVEEIYDASVNDQQQLDFKISDGIVFDQPISDGIALDHFIGDAENRDIISIDTVSFDVIPPRDIANDYSISDLFIPDLPPTCNPSCKQICSMVQQWCGQLVYDCLGHCAAWSSDQYNCIAAEVCKSSGPNCDTVRKCFNLNPTDKPDLVISSFSANVVGDRIDYQIEVCNKSSIGVTSYMVDLYYNRQTPPPLLVFGDEYRQMGPLQPNACHKISLSRNNTPVGTYVSWVQIDANNSIDENDESNNVSNPVKVSVQNQTQEPDLVISSIKITQVTKLTTTVNYEINICNKGLVSSPSSQVHVYYDRLVAPKQGESGDKLATLTSINPGSCISTRISRTGTPPGTYSSWAQVDPYNNVAESNEANNVYGPLKVDVTNPTNADLKITRFDASLSGTSTVIYRFEICNVGKSPSIDTDLQVYYNKLISPKVGEVGDQLRTISGLSAGACRNYTIYRTGTPPGTYTSWAQVDAYNQIQEIDENNNIAGPINVSVGQQNLLPDLQVDTYSITANSSIVTFYGSFCNRGQNPSGPFTVEIYDNQSTPPPATLKGTYSLRVTNLQPNDCSKLKFTSISIPPGSYISYMVIDRLGEVKESNENNNYRAEKYTVPLPTMNCFSICSVTVQCGIFTFGDLNPCLNWCQNLDPNEKTCVDIAASNKDCAALKTCAPLPPVDFCSDTCDWLLDPCQLINALQYSACISICNNLSDTQLACVKKAKTANQCNDAINCVF